MEEKGWVLRVAFEVPPGHHLYSEQLAFLFSDRGRLEEFELPTPTIHFDTASQQARSVYSRSFVAVHRFGTAKPEPIQLTLNYQGCEGANCFMPKMRRWKLQAGQAPMEVEVREGIEETPLQGGWKRLMEDFAVVGKGGGLMTEGDWGVFLEKSLGSPLEDKRLESVARSRLFLMFGGAALALGIAMRRYAQLRHPEPLRLVRGTSVGLMVLAFGLVAGFFRERWPRGDNGDPYDVSMRGESNPVVENRLAQLLAQSKAKNRPVVVYFWAPWSESCQSVTRVLATPRLQALLEGVTVLRLEADDLRGSPIRELFGFFSVRSVPAYLVLKPKQGRVASVSPQESSDEYVLKE
jgi:thiol:disulfide interchange protein